MSQREDQAPSFLGTGWAFPPSFGLGGAQVDMVSGAEDVHQSLAILLQTRAGERVMQEAFGASLEEFMFEEVDHGLVNQITTLVYDAVLRDEPRVELVNVDVTPDEREAGLLRVRLDYRILETNTRYNMVFPFYLNEATGVGL